MLAPTGAAAVPTGALPAPTGALPVRSAAPSGSVAVAPVAPPTQRVSLGELLGGRYRVDQRIGVGGMAEVYRGHDTVLGRDVAIKLFRGDGELPEGSNGEQRRGAELQALAQLSHPNLITLYDGMVTPKAPGDRAYLVMELITGPNLAGRLSTGPLSEPEARAIGGQIADALSYVHAHGMVHRDVKPANILLGQDASGEDAQPRPRLSDFGIVRLLGSEHVTTADVLVGTASYLAPEQARGDEVGPAADVYALGLVLLEGLTGRRCFEGSALEVAMARLARSPEIPPELPEPWPALLAAMTAMAPEDRPRASQVAELLRGTSDPTVLSALPAGPAAASESIFGTTGGYRPEWLAAAAAEPAADEQPAPERRAARRAALVGLVAAAVLTLGAGGYLLAQSPTTHLPAAPATTPSSSRQAPAARTTAASHSATTTAAPATSQAASSAPPRSSSAPATTTASRTSAAPSTKAAVAPSASTTPSGTSSSTGPATTGSTSSPAGTSGTSTVSPSPAATATPS